MQTIGAARPAGATTRWGRPWPLAGRVLLVAALYLAYLPFNGFQGEGMPYDAGNYWELAVQFQRHHQQFSLLNYDSPLRGYLGPLLAFPALALRFFTGCTMLQAAKVWGAAWAAALFGAWLPAAWTRYTGRPIAGGRWLLLVGASFALWRDHFSFTLMDMPALALLLLGLAALARAGWAHWLLAGAALAGSSNVRPVYLVSLPALLLLSWAWQRHFRQSGQTGAARRWAALLLGVALVLGPQLVINWVHFHRVSPLAVGVKAGQRYPLALQQLTWGTRVQFYQTSLADGCNIGVDEPGVALLQELGISTFASYWQYARVVAEHPVFYASRYLRHLFNGLDVQHASPYLWRRHGLEQRTLQLLNYLLLALGLAAIRWRRPGLLQAGALLALLLPCAAALPMAIEQRFLLPLHLLLLTLATLRFSPAAWRQQPRRALWFAGLLALGLAVSYQLSARKDASLRAGVTYLVD